MKIQTVLKKSAAIESEIDKHESRLTAIDGSAAVLRGDSKLSASNIAEQLDMLENEKQQLESAIEIERQRIADLVPDMVTALESEKQSQGKKAVAANRARFDKVDALLAAPETVAGIQKIRAAMALTSEHAVMERLQLNRFTYEALQAEISDAANLFADNEPADKFVAESFISKHSKPVKRQTSGVTITGEPTPLNERRYLTDSDGRRIDPNNRRTLKANFATGW